VEAVGIATAVYVWTTRLCVVSERDAVGIAHAIARAGGEAGGALHLVAATEHDGRSTFSRVGVAEGERVKTRRFGVRAAGPREETNVGVVPFVVGVARTKRSLVAIPRSAIALALHWRDADTEIAGRDKAAVLKHFEPRGCVAAWTSAACRTATQ